MTRSRRPSTGTPVDKILECSKTVTGDVVTYQVWTEDRMQYKVIQRVHADQYTETIYFMARGVPHLLRKITLPLQRMPRISFKEFIEGVGQDH